MIRPIAKSSLARRQGVLVVGNDKNGEGGEQFTAPTYAVRPPRVPHGPFSSRGGCIMFEMNYYNEPLPRNKA